MVIQLQFFSQPHLISCESSYTAEEIQFKLQSYAPIERNSMRQILSFACMIPLRKRACLHMKSSWSPYLASEGRCFWKWNFLFQIRKRFLVYLSSYQTTYFSKSQGGWKGNGLDEKLFIRSKKDYKMKWIIKSRYLSQ